MIVQLYRYHWQIVWECENGGQLWGSPAETGNPSTTTMPNTLCSPGWQSLFTIFIVALLVDLVFQVSRSAFNCVYRRTNATVADLYALLELAFLQTARALQHHERPFSRR